MNNYIVFDLEWNQGDAPVTRDGKTLVFEIVEIGAVKLNENREKIGEFSRLIRPQVHQHMHRITGKLIREDPVFDIYGDRISGAIMLRVFDFNSFHSDFSLP